EEIVKVEDEIVWNVAVDRLLMRQLNVEPDGLASGQGRSALSGFHHAARAAGTDDEVMMAGQGFRPFRQPPRELDRVLVITREAHSGLGASLRHLEFCRIRTAPCDLGL